MVGKGVWAGEVTLTGAIPEANVTKRTNLLVIGDGFTGADPADFATGKAVRAVAHRPKGQAIENLCERDLFALLEEKNTAGRRTPA